MPVLDVVHHLSSSYDKSVCRDMSVKKKRPRTYAYVFLGLSQKPIEGPLSPRYFSWEEICSVYGQVFVLVLLP